MVPGRVCFGHGASKTSSGGNPPPQTYCVQAQVKNVMFLCKDCLIFATPPFTSLFYYGILSSQSVSLCSLRNNLNLFCLHLLLLFGSCTLCSLQLF